MSAPWSRDRDKRLLRLQAKGLTASQIAEQLGTTRSAVLGRSARLRGVVFPSQTRQAERDKVARTKRRHQNNHRNATAVAAMRRAIAKGVDRDQAIIAAVRARASYQAIADELAYRDSASGFLFAAARASTRASRVGQGVRTMAPPTWPPVAWASAWPAWARR
jgi:ParB-like chromosome segregation protein Spo0J